MITREEFDLRVEDITEKARFVAEGLESLWQFVSNLATGASNGTEREKLRNIASRIENLQFNDYGNPSQLESKMGFSEFYSILEENEKTKDLDKLIEYERFYKKVSEMTKKLEEKVK